MTSVEVKSLSKRYGDLKAVDDLSFRLVPGRVTGLLGPNGSGKSTTMRMMVGLEIGGGEVLFDGVPYSELNIPVKHVGVLLDARAAHPTRTISNHLRMMAVGSGIERSRVNEVLEIVGLTSHAGARPNTLSLGMSQRFGIACALIGSPSVLILDEPSNGLDPQGINWLRAFLRSFAKAGNSVLLSSHLLAELQQIADDVVVIGRGRLLASATMNDFIQSASTSQVRVRTLSPDALSTHLRQQGGGVVQEADGLLTVDGLTQLQIAEAGIRSGALIYELFTQPASLEESFLKTAFGETQFDSVLPDGTVL